MAYPYLALRPIKNELVSQRCWQVARIPCLQTWGVSIIFQDIYYDAFTSRLYQIRECVKQTKVDDYKDLSERPPFS